MFRIVRKTGSRLCSFSISSHFSFDCIFLLYNDITIIVFFLTLLLVNNCFHLNSTFYTLGTGFYLFVFSWNLSSNQIWPSDKNRHNKLTREGVQYQIYTVISLLIRLLIRVVGHRHRVVMVDRYPRVRLHRKLFF